MRDSACFKKAGTGLFPSLTEGIEFIRVLVLLADFGLERFASPPKVMDIRACVPAANTNVITRVPIGCPRLGPNTVAEDSVKFI